MYHALPSFKQHDFATDLIPLVKFVLLLVCRIIPNASDCLRAYLETLSNRPMKVVHGFSASGCAVTNFQNCLSVMTISVTPAPEPNC
jgi:hypothetical protein